jgi:transcriptional regulator with XRE-family HTH domain
MYSTVNNNTNDFVRWLKGEMKARGWSQAELARRAGVTRGAIGNVLRGDRGPGRDLLIAIAGALNYPPETVFREAQFFPETGEDPRFEILRHLLMQMSEEDRSLVVAFARMILSFREQRDDVEDLRRRIMELLPERKQELAALLVEVSVELGVTESSLRRRNQSP